MASQSATDKLPKSLSAIDKCIDALNEDDVVANNAKSIKKECESLQNKLSELNAKIYDLSTKEEQKENAKNKKEIKIPFEIIKDEAYCITDPSRKASMCVTSCDGELNPPFISSKGIKWLKSNFNTGALDIFVDTYAKCGTTVGIKMIYKILEMNGKISAGSNSAKLNDPWNAVPWIEVDVSQQLLKSASPNGFLSFIESSNKEKTPRIWKTHAPFVNFPGKIGAKTKILHIIRNPKDVICSYYDFFRKEPLVNYQGSFDTLFDWFCDGSVVHNSFFEFELNWFRAQKNGILNEDQLLIISYEDLVRKPNEIIGKVSKFLGYDMDKTQIENIAEAISFKKSKEEAQKSSDIAVIVNKGKIGRWKDNLTQQQSDRMDRIMNGRLKDCGIEFTFE